MVRRAIANRTDGKPETEHQRTHRMVREAAEAAEVYPVLSGWPSAPAIETFRILYPLPQARQDEIIRNLEASGLKGQPGLDFVKASQRGRITVFLPGMVPAPINEQAPAPVARITDATTQRRRVALKALYQAALTAAREYPDGDTDYSFLIHIANDAQEMLSGL